MPTEQLGVLLDDEELVVLLDEEGNAIGTAPKASVHHDQTPLHRAFSCYVFDQQDRLLLTRRSATKVAFPDVWTNSVCGHPGPGETDLDAIARRARHELGLQVTAVSPGLPDYRYRARSGDVVENEICPVYLARAVGSPVPDPAEVQATAWFGWPDYQALLDARAGVFSPWALDQSARLAAAGTVEDYLRQSRSPRSDEQT